MEKDIDSFVTELVDYINTFITGSEYSYIVKCEASDTVTNRGRSISVLVKIPDDIDKNLNIGPCFYVDELLEQFPNATVAAIAENINAMTTRDYFNMVAILRMQDAAMKKTIDEYEAENCTIITAVPTSQTPKGNNTVFITKKYPEFGLTTIMKAKIYSNSDQKSRAYFAPVCRTKGRRITKRDWDLADKNTIQGVKIEASCMPVLTEEKAVQAIPAFGNLEDKNRFYDFFYLLSPEYAWRPLIDRSGAEKIYIIPTDAWSAKFIIDSPVIRNNFASIAPVVKLAINSMTATPTKEAAYVLNCSTMKITSMMEGEKENADQCSKKQ